MLNEASVLREKEIDADVSILGDALVLAESSVVGEFVLGELLELNKSSLEELVLGDDSALIKALVLGEASVLGKILVLGKVSVLSATLSLSSQGKLLQVDDVVVLKASRLIVDLSLGDAGMSFASVRNPSSMKF